MERILKNRLRVVSTLLICIIISLLAQAWLDNVSAYQAALMSAESTKEITADMTEEQKLATQEMNKVVERSALISSEKFKAKSRNDLALALIVAIVLVIFIISTRAGIDRYSRARSSGTRTSNSALKVQPLSGENMAIIIFVHTVTQIGKIHYQGDLLKNMRFTLVAVILVLLYFLIQPRALGVKKLKVGRVEKSSRNRRHKRKKKTTFWQRFRKRLRTFGTTSFCGIDEQEGRSEDGDTHYRDKPVRDEDYDDYAADDYEPDDNDDLDEGEAELYDDYDDYDDEDDVTTLEELMTVEGE